MRIVKDCLMPLALVCLAGAAQAQDSVNAAHAQTIDNLKNNSGISLQWIDWDMRGTASVREKDGEIFLAGSQIAGDGPGTLWLDGKITEVGDDYFIFEGLIRIANSPDQGRVCEAQKKWRFAITQNRKYYRLREFEWCDGLTDYIDIYF